VEVLARTRSEPRPVLSSEHTFLINLKSDITDAGPTLSQSVSRTSNTSALRMSWFLRSPDGYSRKVRAASLDPPEHWRNRYRLMRDIANCGIRRKDSFGGKGHHGIGVTRHEPQFTGALGNRLYQ